MVWVAAAASPPRPYFSAAVPACGRNPSSGSATYSRARTVTMAPTWLRMIAPMPIPSAAPRAVAAPPPAMMAAAWVPLMPAGMCRAASSGRVMAVASSVVARPKASPAAAMVMSLAASSGVRRGGIRTAGGMVLCRNSLVTESTPASSATVWASPAMARTERAGLMPGVKLVAAADHDDVIDGLGDLGQDVAGDQDGAALCGQRAEQIPQPPDALRVQAVGGLVEHQDLRVAEQGGGQAEPLPHAERVAPRPLPARACQADPLQQLSGPAAGYPGLGGQHSQVVAARAAGVGGGGIQQRADRPGRAGQLGIGFPGDHGGAGVGADQPQDHPQCGGLPRAVGAEEPGDPAIGDSEGHILHRHHAAELLAQADRLDRQACGGGRAAQGRPGMAGHRPAALCAGGSGHAARPAVRCPPRRRPAGHNRPRLWPAWASTLVGGARARPAATLALRCLDSLGMAGAQPGGSSCCRASSVRWAPASGRRAGLPIRLFSGSRPRWAAWRLAICGTAMARSSTPWTWLLV